MLPMTIVVFSFFVAKITTQDNARKPTRKAVSLPRSHSALAHRTEKGITQLKDHQLALISPGPTARRR